MYDVLLSRIAERHLNKVAPVYYGHVLASLRALANNPRPYGYIKLTGYKNTYRIRVGIYRIIYTVEDKLLTVNVVKIDHRRNVYE